MLHVRRGYLQSYRLTRFHPDHRGIKAVPAHDNFNLLGRALTIVLASCGTNRET